MNIIIHTKKLIKKNKKQNVLTNNVNFFFFKNLVKNLCSASDYYTDENAIIQEIKKYNTVSEKMIISLISKFSYGIKNKCIDCGVDMGIHNPRQFCGKLYCKNFY